MKFLFEKSKNIDLVIMVAITLLEVCLIIIWPSWQSPIRIILGFLVVLIVPGYILTSLLFPQKDDIDGVERLALSLGLSIAVIPLIGLILDKTPWGIRLIPIALSLGLFVICLSGFTLWRRSFVPIQKRYYLPLDNSGFLRAAGAITLIITFFVGLVIFGLSLRPEEKFTEFYILGAEGKLENYVTELKPYEFFSVKLGITNHEGEDVKYTVRAPFQDNAIIAEMSVIADSTWEENIFNFASSEIGRQKIAFDLYREGEKEIYRSVHLFIDIVSE